MFGAPSRKKQQLCSFRDLLPWPFKEELPKLISEWGPARFACFDYIIVMSAEGSTDAAHEGGLTAPVDSFKRDEHRLG
jgi:hypothetical protein